MRSRVRSPPRYSAKTEKLSDSSPTPSRARPGDRLGDQELHQPVRRLAAAAHRRERVVAAGRRRDELEEAADAAVRPGRDREHRVRVREERVHRHREAALGPASAPLLRDRAQLAAQRLVDLGRRAGARPGSRPSRAASPTAAPCGSGGRRARSARGGRTPRRRGRSSGSRGPRSRGAPRRSRPRSRPASAFVCATRRNSATSSHRSAGSPIGSPATIAVPAIDAVGEERAAARREEDRLVRRSAKYARLSLPCSRTSASARRRSSGTCRARSAIGRSQRKSARAASTPTVISERVVDALGVGDRPVEVEQRDHADDRERQRDLDQRPDRLRDRPGATNCRRALSRRSRATSEPHASSTSRPFARCVTADATTSATASCQARRLRRASPRASQSSAKLIAIVSVRAAERPAGREDARRRTCSGSRPRASATRRAPIRPTSAAARRPPPETDPPHDYRVDAQAVPRRADPKAPYSRTSTRRSSSSLPGSRIASTESPGSSCIESSGTSALPLRTIEITREPSRQRDLAGSSCRRRRALVDRDLDDLEVLLAQLEQVDQPVLGHLVLDQAHDRRGRRHGRRDPEQVEVRLVARVVDARDRRLDAVAVAGELADDDVVLVVAGDRDDDVGRPLDAGALEHEQLGRVARCTWCSNSASSVSKRARRCSISVTSCPVRIRPRARFEPTLPPPAIRRYI